MGGGKSLSYSMWKDLAPRDDFQVQCSELMLNKYVPAEESFSLFRALNILKHMSLGAFKVLISKKGTN